jgi:hypothetical protein
MDNHYSFSTIHFPLKLFIIIEKGHEKENLYVANLLFGFSRLL